MKYSVIGRESLPVRGALQHQTRPGERSMIPVLTARQKWLAALMAMLALAVPTFIAWDAEAGEQRNEIEECIAANADDFNARAICQEVYR